MVMDPLEAINGVAAGIQGGLQYLQNNAWAMMFLFIVGYVIKTNGTSLKS